MTEQNEIDQVVVRPEWHAPMMREYTAAEAESNLINAVPDLALTS